MEHQDHLQSLNDAQTVQQKLRHLHDAVKQQHPAITRIAVALYDDKTDALKTFIYSADQHTPLEHYQTTLAQTPQLATLAQQGKTRVINDLRELSDSDKPHTQALLEAGYLASYTVPMVFNGHFFGFVFFNAAEVGVFEETLLVELDSVSHLVTLLVFHERANVRTLLATLKSALDLSHGRDPETGSHLERMSRYARLIARKLARQWDFDDQYIEHIYLFAPLHDLGKITVPDRVLLKPGKLTDEEFEEMKLHAINGRQLLDKLIDNYGLSGIGHIDMLKNIANHHHEALDGSGYPDGLKGNDIPVEARIVAVADVFDALTSERPYKKAWSNQQAIDKLRELAGIKLDPDCVNALLDNMEEVEQIQRTFAENPVG
ncbi:HD-GYP domain-containing protein [Aestuariibacter halophilus]|uniref:HD-GYP domain-containing protein n=1 Tax=Fluctibacter halophilus TaxID=226011 RepID=A0ABS8G345_9ALTE|nr:HD domain-containing phosphohydrolase [Aestuariibacter halophilus]MCC2614950.1 HD-GYP domain-containing protein [Aestuariibacter halophilus]